MLKLTYPRDCKENKGRATTYSSNKKEGQGNGLSRRVFPLFLRFLVGIRFRHGRRVGKARKKNKGGCEVDTGERGTCCQPLFVCVRLSPWAEDFSTPMSLALAVLGMPASRGSRVFTFSRLFRILRTRSQGTTWLNRAERVIVCPLRTFLAFTLRTKRRASDRSKKKTSRKCDENI